MLLLSRMPYFYFIKTSVQTAIWLYIIIRGSKTAWDRGLKPSFSLCSKYKLPLVSTFIMDSQSVKRTMCQRNFLLPTSSKPPSCRNALRILQNMGCLWPQRQGWRSPSKAELVHTHRIPSRLLQTLRGTKVFSSYVDASLNREKKIPECSDTNENLYYTAITIEHCALLVSKGGLRRLN